eukprot:g895.t1
MDVGKKIKDEETSENMVVGPKDRSSVVTAEEDSKTNIGVTPTGGGDEKTTTTTTIATNDDDDKISRDNKMDRGGGGDVDEEMNNRSNDDSILKKCTTTTDSTTDSGAASKDEVDNLSKDSKSDDVSSSISSSPQAAASLSRYSRRKHVSAHVECPICAKMFLRSEVQRHAHMCALKMFQEESPKRTKKKNLLQDKRTTTVVVDNDVHSSPFSPTTVVMSSMKSPKIPSVTMATVIGATEEDGETKKKKKKTKVQHVPRVTVSKIFEFDVYEKFPRAQERKNIIRAATIALRACEMRRSLGAGALRRSMRRRKVQRFDAAHGGYGSETLEEDGDIYFGNEKAVRRGKGSKNTAKKKKKRKKKKKEENATTDGESVKPKKKRQRKIKRAADPAKKKKKKPKKKPKKPKKAKKTHEEEESDVSAADVSLQVDLKFLPTKVVGFSKYAPPGLRRPRNVGNEAASEYIQDLTVTYSGQPALLQRFFYILREFSRDEMDIQNVVNQVANLFGDRIDFMIQFNQFLPEGMWMEDLPQFRRGLKEKLKETHIANDAAHENELQIARLFVAKVKNFFKDEPGKFQSFLKIVTSADAGFEELHQDVDALVNSVDEVLDKCRGLFRGEEGAELFQSFVAFMPPADDILKAKKTDAPLVQAQAVGTTTAASIKGGEEKMTESKEEDGATVVQARFVAATSVSPSTKTSVPTVVTAPVEAADVLVSSEMHSGET